MIRYKEAQDIIKGHSMYLDKELVDIDDAFGRVLAEDIAAERDFPPFNRSAMDGIAIKTEDFNKGIRNFQIVETIFAGQKHKNEISTGQCYKIMTGAAVPPGANAVIRREDFIERGNIISVNTSSCSDLQNIAAKGQDLKKNTIAIRAPFKINASAVGFLASLGREKVLVYKKPEVAIFTTGNEVIFPGQPVNDFQIYNSNLYLLKAMLAEHGIKPVHTAHILDNEELLRNTIEPWLDADIIILSGGVSAGDADFVPGILSQLGVEILFHKVAIKPGKPVLCGKLRSGGLVFALPGNPFSCQVTFKLFVETYLESIYKLPASKKIRLPLNFDRAKKSSFDEFFPVFITEESTLNKSEINGSGDIRMASFANALGIQPADRMTIRSGEEILCISL